MRQRRLEVRIGGSDTEAGSRGSDSEVLLAFSRAFDFSPSSVFATDAKGLIRYANSCFSTGLGLELEQLWDRSLSSIGLPPDNAIACVLDDGQPWQGCLSFSIESMQQTGTFLATPVLRADGVREFVLCIGDLSMEADVSNEPISPSAPLVLVVDLDGTILFVDRTVPGVSREDAIGASIYAYMPADHHDRIRAYLAEVVEKKGSMSYQVPSIGPYGSLLLYQTHVGPIEREGEVVALSFVSWEVNEEALEVEDRNRVLAEAGIEGIIIHEADSIVDANPAACRMFGYVTAELVGKPLSTIFDPALLGRVLRPSFHEGGNLHEGNGVQRDGATFPIEVCGKSLPHPRGLSTVIAIRDIRLRERQSRSASRGRRNAGQQLRKAKRPSGPIRLSQRELDVLELLAQGLTNREVSERIHLSARTVDHHVSHILAKLGAPNRTAAAMTARRRGLLRTDK